MVIKQVELQHVCGITSKLPDTGQVEVAFAGKSNVGKSSLINALMNRKSLARTSAQPGKTQTINYYHINDETLDKDIIDARSTADQEDRKSVYKQCLDIILDWAVEIPIYQRQNCVIYSPERINADTFTKDVTTFYPWYGDIINIEMN